MAKRQKIQFRNAKRNKYANKAQTERIEKLKKKYPNLKIIIHNKCGDMKLHVLMELGNRGAYWLFPDGRLKAAKSPSPFCMGGPTMADCVNAGYCTRSISCSE